MGSRAGRALDRPAHRRRGVRARRRRASPATTRSCSTSSATCSSRSTSSSLLLEERGHGSLAEVADHVHAKLVRRHPHIFGEVEVEAPARCCGTGTRSRRARTGREPGIFGDVPENLPGPLYALKTQRRAASTGFDFDHVPYERRARRAGRAGGGVDARGALPRGRRRAVRGGQRRPQAEGRPGARAAGLERALPGPRGGRRGARGARRRRLGRARHRRAAGVLRAGAGSSLA